MAHSVGNGIGKSVVLYAPRARRLHLEPIYELPYGPAALNGRTEGRTEVSTQLRPHHPADCPCVHGGAHRREPAINLANGALEGVYREFETAAFVVTNLSGSSARALYEMTYCQRGQAENHLKAWKRHLA